MTQLWKVVLNNTLVALALTFVMLLFRSDWRLFWLEQFFACLLYSQLVGTTANFTMEWAGPKLARYRPSIFFTGSFVILTLVGIAGAFASNLVLLVTGILTPKYLWRNFYEGASISVVVTLVVGFLFALKGFYEQRLAQAELERERALKLAAEAKLQSLESLVHPHFLFNALNSISSLIHEDPAQAERMVEQVSALLRYSLDSSQGGLVPLEMELKIVRDYLGIQQTRFGSRLSFSITAPPEILQAKLPPLAIQTLVENSIKHTLSHSQGQVVIKVEARQTAGNIILEVKDSGAGFAEDKIIPGHGLATLRARLNSLFPDKASLSVAGSTVRMEFPA